MARVPGSRPIASTPSAARAGLRPVATSNRSAASVSPPASATVNRCPSCLTPVAAAPTITAMPSRPNTSASIAPASGSSMGSSRPAASTTVTCAPNLANTCESSAPIAPPPRTMSEPGTSSVSMASRLVQYGDWPRPSIGGMDGSVPDAITIERRARITRRSATDSTVISSGAVSRPRPRMNRPPLPVNRSTATLSSQLSVASSRICGRPAASR